MHILRRKNGRLLDAALVLGMALFAILVVVPGYIAVARESRHDRAVALSKINGTYYAQDVLLVKSALSGQPVEVEQLARLRQEVRTDTNFSTALLKAGVSVQDIDRITGPEFQYFRHK